MHQQQYEKLSHYRFTKVAAPKRMVITGNEALALGAVKAGMKFYAPTHDALQRDPPHPRSLAGTA